MSNRPNPAFMTGTPVPVGKRATAISSQSGKKGAPNLRQAKGVQQQAQTRTRPDLRKPGKN